MNSGQSVFTQLISLLPLHEFRKCVARYDGNRRIRSFSCWDQFLCMAFAQLTYRQSLRDIQICLRAQGAKLYHLGIRGHIAKSTLGDANELRDWRIYQDFALTIIAIAQDLYAGHAWSKQLDRAVYALDSTTVDLCLALFPWAKFRRHKAAVKIHTLLDVASQNVVKAQIWIAITVYVLVAILKKQMNLKTPLSKILQVFSVHVFERTPITELLCENESLQNQNDSCKQLLLFDF